jgi:hypothetical protein
VLRNEGLSSRFEIGGMLNIVCMIVKKRCIN